MSDREVERLRDFYRGLTDVMEKCHKRMIETHSTIEGLMTLCQEHLTMLADLEYENANLMRENRNLKAYQNQKEEGKK